MVDFTLPVAEPTNARQIAEFESHRRIALPRRYRDFLLAANGGYPVQSVFPVVGPNAASEWMIEVFFGIHADNHSNALETAFDTYTGAIPAGVLQIGGDGMANYICLDLRSGQEKIVLWDKREFWGSGKWREADLFPIENSFEAFLALLRIPSGS